MRLLCLDIGGSFIKYALVTDRDWLSFEEYDTLATPLDSLESFVDIVGSVYDKYENIVDGIAISLPGIVDSTRGYCFTGGMLEYNYNQPIGDLLRMRCNTTVHIENDGRCAALAEAWRGSLKNCRDGIVIVLGSSVGGGVIKDGLLHRGAHGVAGEFGYVMRFGAGYDLHSTWGYESGILSLIEGVAMALESNYIRLVGGVMFVGLGGLSEKELAANLAALNGERIFELAQQGCMPVLQVLEEYTKALALQIYNLQMIYDPEIIAIGGGISNQPLLFDFIRENLNYLYECSPFDRSCIPSFITQVVPCSFNNDSNIVGAIYHYLIREGIINGNEPNI